MIINVANLVSLKKKKGRKLRQTEANVKVRRSLVHFTPPHRFPFIPQQGGSYRRMQPTAACPYKFSTRTALNCFISTPFPIGTQAICHDKGVPTFSSHTTLL